MKRFVASSGPARDPRAWSPGALGTLCAVLALHAGLVAWVVASLFPESIYNPVDATSLRQLVTIAVVALVAVSLASRGQPVASVGVAVLAVGLALLLPGPVATALLIVVDAWLIGAALLRAVARDGGALTPNAVLCTLCGLAIMIALLSVAAPWPVHHAAVYAAMLALPLVIAPARLLAPGRQLPGRGDAATWSIPERTWLGLLGALVVVHVFVVAKPEVGYDALAMHLQFARMLAADHAWTFDVQRFGWSLMPLGADWMFGLAYVLAGEAGARTVNLAFAGLCAALVYQLARTAAPRLPALVSVALLASAPLTFLVTGSLFAEALWCAFLLGSLVAALAWRRSHAPADLAAVALCAAGALQCKAISLLWLAPLGVVLLAGARGSSWKLGSVRLATIVVVAALAGAWPYANAAWRTGNPVFPFFNAWFRSPLLDAQASFTNPLYHVPLLPWTPYALVVDSARFLEGQAGAPGFHWLLALPLIALAAARGRFSRAQWMCLAVALAFFVLVFVQQAYLRYLLPALLVMGAAVAWALADLPDRRATRVAVGIVACLLIALNLRFMYTGSWYQATVCRRCAFDASARHAYIVRYATLRVVAEWLTEHLPDARVGFFVLNDASPAGYTGYSRGGNWHDLAAFTSLVQAGTADDVAVIARRFGLTHVVVRVNAEPEEHAIAAFRDRDTQPVWQFENYRVAVVTLAEPAPASAVSATR